MAEPPQLEKDTLRIVPLGGIGEIGRNMTVFELNGELLIVDCGVLFPEENHPGVDLILPDFSPIRDRLDAISAIVLTHGHEDHIGGIPYLLRMRPDIPIYGSRLSLAFVEAKLREHRLSPTTHVVRDDERVKVGQFDLEFIAANHSIPDAFAIAIRTVAGLVFHSGDFKLDQLPIDGRLTDLPAFARLGTSGVDLFMCDSTNADTPGFVDLERDIGPVLARVIRNATQLVVVTSFASHVHRVQQVLDAAASAGRVVAFMGRSMVRNMSIAADLGYLHVPDGVVVDLKEAARLPSSRVVYMSTGSQGEPMSALARMANRDHTIVLETGDTVILASSLIPGNENAVYRVINALSKLGAVVIHKGIAPVHVSGHASAGELVYCYNILKPKAVMPIHGEQRHLVANADLAVLTGVPREQTFIVADGTVVDMRAGATEIAGQLDVGYVYVDGPSVGEITESDLKDRRILAEEGFISIFCAVDAQSGDVLVGPEIEARGFAEDPGVFDAVIPLVRDALKVAVQNGTTDTQALQQVMRRTVGRWVNTSYRRRPMIVPVIIEA
jgi:ribonuclease J